MSKFPSFSRLSNAPLQGQTTCCLFLCSLGDRQSLGVSPLAKVSTAAVDTGVHVPHILCGLPPEPTLPLPAAARGNATAESGPWGSQLSLPPLPALAPAGWAGQELPGLGSRLRRGAEPAGVCLHLGLSVQGGGGVGRHPAPAAEPGTGATAFRSPLGPAPWCDIPLQQDAGRQAGLLTRRGTPTGTRGGASVPPLVFRPLQVQTKARLSACTQLREPLPTQSFCPPLQLGELASGNGAIQLQASHTLAQA